MTRDRAAGIAILTGVLAPLLLIGLHPTGHDLAAEGSSHLLLINYLVHGVAIAAQPILFLGLLGLTSHLGNSKRAIAGLVVWGSGAVAVLIAAALSGFVAPEVIDWQRDATGSQAESWQALLAYTGWLNRAFAGISVIAAGAAIICWSAAIGGTGRLSRFTAILGYVAGTLLVIGVGSGHLRLNVHGIIVTTALQAVWLICVGIHLYRSPFVEPAQPG
jgi:hypothetical protein